MVNTKEILNIMPQSIRKVLENTMSETKLEEIRVKVNKPLITYGELKEKIYPYNATEEDVKAIMQRISNYSIYAFENELKQGYITIKGGHRVGICGNCVMEENKVKTVKDFASVNIRINKEILGCSNKIIQYIVSKGRVLNTIIISPPQCGKTTLLRDIARNLSDGQAMSNFSGKKVSIIDERSEISACYSGIPQMNVGIRTDVLDGCPKSEGIMMAIRSMSPDVIICDEIGTYKDMESIILALNSGVSIITSIHGYGIEDLYNRTVFKDIVDNNVFNRAVVLSASTGAGTIEYIYDFYKKEKLWGR